MLWGAAAVWLGPVVLPFLVLRAAIGFSLLKVVSYIEDFGMLRQKVAFVPVNAVNAIDAREGGADRAAALPDKGAV